MSRTAKDKPWRLTGVYPHRYWTTSTGHAEWKRLIRSAARAAANHDMRNGREPEPVYPIERSYWD